MTATFVGESTIVFECGACRRFPPGDQRVGSRIMLCRYCLGRMLNCPGYHYCTGIYRFPRRREGFVICRWCRWRVYIEWQCRCSYTIYTCGKSDCFCHARHARHRCPGRMICECDVGYGFPPCRRDLGDWCHLCQGYDDVDCSFLDGSTGT